MSDILPPSAPATAPTPSVSPIDTDAVKLQDIETQAANKSVGIDAADKAIATAGPNLADTFTALSQQQKALEFQKVLAGGWDTYTQAWKAAGAPPQGDPSALKTGDPKTDLGPNGTLLAGWKIITGYKGRQDVAAAAAKPGATAVDVASAGVPSGETSPNDLVKAKQDLEDKTAANATKVADTNTNSAARVQAAQVRIQVAKIQTAAKSALETAKDPALIASMKAKSTQLDGITTTLDELEKEPILNAAEIGKQKSAVNRLQYSINQDIKKAQSPSTVATADSIANATQGIGPKVTKEDPLGLNLK